MSSNSLSNFEGQIGQAMLLSQIDLRRVSSKQKQIFLHANLAALVSCWETFVKSIAAEFNDNLMRTTDHNLIQSISISKVMAKRIVSRVNTLNYDNSREIILVCTGYDPISDWLWPAKSLNSTQVKAFLDEILSVRHSFAHGFAMKRFNWNEDARGNVCLSKNTVVLVKDFFRHLGNVTDRQLAQSIRNRFNGTASW
jgi:hypothetical protein